MIASKKFRLDYLGPVMAAGFVLASLTPSVSAQMGGALQEKLAAIKHSAAENKQKLQQYTWTETVQLTLKGEPKPPKEYRCSYGPDGKVQKVPIGPQTAASPAQGGGGRFKQRIVQKKTAEMKDYMEQVQGLISLYVPPDPDKMQQAFQEKNVSFNPEGEGNIGMVFRNYAQPGDSMTIDFSTAAKKMTALSIKSYLDNPQDGVTLHVDFASLPDGTNYTQQSTLNAQAKNLTVVTTSSNFRKLGQ